MGLLFMLAVLIIFVLKGLEVDTYDAVIGTALAAEEERLVVFDAFVNYSVREHGLRGDAEDEHAEGEILGWLGVCPHLYTGVSESWQQKKLSLARESLA